MAVRTVELSGFDEFLADLERLPESLRTGVYEEALTAAAVPVVLQAKANAPVDTGQLRDAIDIQGLSVGRALSSVSIGTSDKDYTGQEFYAAFNEHGTARQEARPFLRPAIDAKQGEAEAILAEKLGVGVEEALRE